VTRRRRILQRVKDRAQALGGATRQSVDWRISPTVRGCQNPETGISDRIGRNLCAGISRGSAVLV